MMSHIIADNIISPLGRTSRDNYLAVKRGESRLRRYDSRWNLKEPFVGSLFDDSEWQSIMIEGLTRFESLACRSIDAALAQCDIDPSSPRVALIISTTKGNVEALADTDADIDRQTPGGAAMMIARHVGVTTTPIVVCNACISGVAALVLADRMIRSGKADDVIVSGIDVQSEFIVSGFQSFKALSEDECKPFDANRTGLNLGEAAATIILSSRPGAAHSAGSAHRDWRITAGAICNDANHISAPSRTAEGSLRALRSVVGDNTDDLAMISVHGTATSYNDQMESIAIERAGLSPIPINSYKGYYGHTMGAAGVLESILSMHAVDDSTIPGTRGLVEKGVPGEVNISAHNRPTDGESGFVKLLSGFGGCNGAIRMTRNDANQACATPTHAAPVITPTHHVRVTPEGAWIDGERMNLTSTGKDILTEIYRSEVKSYPKFFKMDTFTRLAFVASELLLNAEGEERFVEREDRPVVLFNQASSLYADLAHQLSISDPDNYFPSPSIFVYTLPNITTGEIAIRNRYLSETSFYVLPKRDDSLIGDIAALSAIGGGATSMITGWVDCVSDNEFVADMWLNDVSYPASNDKEPPVQGFNR